MASALSVNVTADTTDLRSKLALAQADLRAYGTEVRNTANQLRMAAEDAQGPLNQQLSMSAEAYNKAKASVMQLKDALGEASAAQKVMTGAIETSGHAINSTGAAREALVLAHEVMTGRTNRLAGSLMVMAERMGGGSAATMGLVGAFSVAAMGAMHLVEWLDKVAEAKDKALAAGIGGAVSNDALVDQVTKLAKIGSNTRDMSGTVVAEFARMQGMTTPVMDLMTSSVNALALRMDTDVPQAAGKMRQAFELNLTAGSELLEGTRASKDAIAEFAAAVQNDDALKARTILLTELARNTREVAQATSQKTLTDEGAARAQAQAMAAAQDAMAFQGAGVMSSGGEDKQAAMQGAVQDAKRLADALASVNDQMKSPAPVAWSEQTRNSLAQMTLATEQASRAQGKSWDQIHIDMTAKTVEFWQQQVAETKEGSKNREAATRELLAAQEALEREQVLESQKNQKQITKDAKEELRERLADLTQQQAAYHDDFATVIRLEDQKVALLRAFGKGATVELDNELKNRENLIREHNQRMAEQAMQDIQRSIELGKQQTDARKAELDAQVADGEISKSAEIRQIAEMAAAQYQQNQQALASFIELHAGETDIVAKAKAEQLSLEAQYQKQVAELQKQAAQVAAQQARQTEQQYARAFDAVGSAGERAFGGFIMGTETAKRAELQFAQAAVQSAMQLGASLAEQWLATELAKTSITSAQTAARVELEQARGNSGLAALLMGWLGLESGKTTATQTGVELRTAAEQSGADAGFIAQAASAIKSITLDAGQTFGGIFAFLAPEMGPAAVGPAAAGQAAVLSFANLASFDVGAWNLPSDMLAQVHEGEMIIPTFQADAIRAGASLSAGGVASGGGTASAPAVPATNVTFSVQAIDASGVAAFFNQHAKTIAATVSRQVNNNLSLRPAY